MVLEVGTGVACSVGLEEGPGLSVGIEVVAGVGSGVAFSVGFEVGVGLGVGFGDLVTSPLLW